MKIAIDIQPLLYSGRSGIGYYQQELLNALIDINDKDSFVLQYFDPKRRHGDMAAFYKDKDVNVEPCKWFSSTLIKMLWMVFPIPYGLFFRSNPDVSIFFNYYLPPYVKGKKLLVVYDTVLKDHPETMNRKTKAVLNLTLKRSIRRADKIITISQFSKDQIIKYYHVSADDIVIIPCAADERKFHPADDREAVQEYIRSKYDITGNYFLYLGTLEPRKNITGLIEAYGKALKKQPAMPLLVISGGKGWLYEQIFQRVKELGISDKVIFTGYVEDSDVPMLMNGADAFCFPSFYEGFGMPPLEAMSCGVPVIVSNTSSLPEVTGDCGISVDPNNTDEIANALIRMTDKKFQKEQSQRSLERAKAFSWKRSAELLNKLLEELVKTTASHE